MDAIIKNADFSHDDDDKLSDYNDKVRDWKNENEEKFSGGELLSALKTLIKKLTQAKCPQHDTRGWQQAMDLFDDLISRVASDLIDEKKLKPDDMRTAYYNMYIDWFQHGPSTIHLNIMCESLGNSDINMKEYLQTLKGEPRLKLISAMFSPIVKTEDTEDKEFYQAHRNKMNSFIGYAVEKSSLLEPDTMKLWLANSFHLYLDYIGLNEKGLDYISREAADRFSEIEDGWESFSDIKFLKSLIERITKATKSPGFPKSKCAVSSVLEPLRKLCKKWREPGDAETYSDCMFDLMESLSVCKGERKHVLEVFQAAVRFFDDQDRDIVKKRVPFFKAVAPRFQKLVGTLDMYLLQDSRYCTDIIDKLEYAYGNNKTLVAEWVALVVPLLQRPCYATLRGAYSVLSCNNAIRWKDHKEVAKAIFKCLTQIQLPADDSKDTTKYIKEYKSCVDYFVRGLEKAKILKEFGEGMMFLGINILELRLPGKEPFELVEAIGEHIEINVKENREKVMEVMKRIHAVLKDENMPWTESWPLQRAVDDNIGSIIKPVNDGRIFEDEDLKVFTAMCHTCLSKDALNPNDTSMSAHFIIGNCIMDKLLDWMASTKRLGYAIRLIPLLLSKFDEDDENVRMIACRYLNEFATGEPATMTNYMDQLIKMYLDKEDVNILRPILTIYPFNPAPLKEHFQVLLEQMLDSGEPAIKSTLVQLFWAASKKQPELFTDKNMKDIITTAKDDPSNQAMLMQILQEVCKRKPERMAKHIDLLMDKQGWDPTTHPWIINMLSTLALHDKNQSNKMISFFATEAERNPHDKGIVLTALNSIRLVGFKYPDVIQPRREDIVKLSVTDVDGQSLKQTILDMVDGKTPDELRKQMEEQQAALSDLVDRVEEVEVVVIAVKDDLDNQGQELQNVKNEVTEQGQVLDQVKETVDDTVIKVEELDSKTLSHAPYWSRDISKLLNPTTEHDWRLLSSRLGYSNADIRGWAQQSDPCMAMLNEWYATRKTSEATYAVLTNLQEMNRMDAALIVENAMKKAEAVVEDEEFEYASPPEIFLSYQWGHQEEVKLLHRHLAMAGYDCWMDIGQMGGGDKLFEKIDNGMRAAKLVISCVTAKYAKSPNCNREVNLAVGVKKPIIPLLMENCSWPPPGSMGPIFSESLYIRFFQTGQEETKDDRYWAEDKFQELLMQLSVNGLTPDEGKIDKVYRNWWMPLEEEINIDKSKTRDGGKVVAVPQNNENAEQEESPDVFISYQWDKQKYIIKLYQRLTSLGFSCWLDIKQMGGGDSLYDKIDRGVRNSKVVLSCVTKKYAMSANCRREVSLTDALKKPLLPLLLEEMTWPPSGPMSMVMTQLLYIGFQQESTQTKWEGPQFDELVGKINQHAPNMSMDRINAGKPQDKNSQPGDKGHVGPEKDDKKSNAPEKSNSPPQSSESPSQGASVSKEETPHEKDVSSAKTDPPLKEEGPAGEDKPQSPKSSPPPVPSQSPPPPKEARAAPPPAQKPDSTPPAKSKSCSIL